MAEHMSLYQRAVYYDVIFDRNVSEEVDFITTTYRHYSSGENPHSILDLACGPGYHALEFARRGVRAVGLDLGAEMLRLAEGKAQSRKVGVDWVRADMREFSLNAPVDLAFIMFDGIDALTTNEDILRHFATVARNLTPQGIYVIDLTHPRDCSHGYYGKFRYHGRRDSVDVEIRWATNKPAFDWVTGVAEVELEMRVKDHGRRFVLRDRAKERMLYPQELALLAELSNELRVVGWHGDFRLEQPFDGSLASKRMIAVLQKQG